MHERQRTKEKMTQFLRARKVPLGLEAKIMGFYQYLWASRKQQEAGGLFVDMHPSLQLEMTICINEGLIKQVGSASSGTCPIERVQRWMRCGAVRCGRGMGVGASVAGADV
jgi:hypothetical protein